jgi:hypothetical protein
MNNQQSIFSLIKAVSGQSNVLTIPRIFIDIAGDIQTALFLSQCVYWSDKTNNPEGWFYKTHAEWDAEIGLSYFQVKRAIDNLKGLVETKIKRANNAPTIHYRVNVEALTKSILEKLEIRETLNSNNFNMDIEETSKSDIEETSKTLTEITHKNTTKNTPPPQNGKPKNKPANPRKARGDTVPLELLNPMIEALAEVTRMDMELNRARIAKDAKSFVLAKYTPELIISIYGERQGRKGKWWTDDWRGKKGQIPGLYQIRETIAGFAKSPQQPQEIDYTKQREEAAARAKAKLAAALEAQRATQ